MLKLFLMVFILNDFHNRLIFTCCSSVNEEPDEYLKTNMVFRAKYDQARQRLLKSFSPVIMVDGSITIIYQGQRQQYYPDLSLYQNLKTVLHVPTTVYLLMFDPHENNRTLSTDELEDLKSYLQQVRVFKKKIQKSDFLSDETLFELQHSILDHSIDYLRQVIRSEAIDVTSLRSFCQESAKFFSRNFELAVQEQVDGMHALLYPWFTKVLNETERQSTQILIVGAKSTRVDLVASQYFIKLFGGQDIEGKQLTYAENLFQIPAAMNVMGAWFLDQKIGDFFFNDYTRLNRDIFSKEARNYIEKVFSSQKSEHETI